MGALPARAAPAGDRDVPHRSGAGLAGTTRTNCSMTASTLISPPRNQTLGSAKLIGVTIAGLIAWFAVYWQLEPFSNWAVAQLPIARGSHLEEATSFFIFDTP